MPPRQESPERVRFDGFDLLAQLRDRSTLQLLQDIGVTELLPPTARQAEGFVRDLFGGAKYGVKRGWTLKQTFDHTYKKMTPKYGDWAIYEHCIPFNVGRAFDEASGLEHPRIWTARRDKILWKELQG